MARLTPRPKTVSRPAQPAPPAPVAVAQPAHPCYAPPAGRAWPYALAVLLLPVLALWHADHALYTPGWYADPWFYLGYFRNLLEYKRDLFYGFYYGSRLSWVLPGALAHTLLPPLAANAVLHLGTHLAATGGLFVTLRFTAGIRAAFLSAMTFAAFPWLWAATGWDYPDGAGIAYCLAGMALLTWAALGPPRRWALAAAGAAMGGQVYSHLFWAVLVPLLPMYYVALVRGWRREPVWRTVAGAAWWIGAGFAAVTAFLAAINCWLDGTWWFYGPSMAQAVSLSKDFVYVRKVVEDGLLVPWLWPPVAASLVAVALLPFRRDWAGRLFSAQLLLAFGCMLALQMSGSTVLGHYPYSSDLLPFVFLVFGSSLWPAVDKMSPRGWACSCAAAAVAFAALWYRPATPWLQGSPAAMLAVTAAGAVLLAAAVVTRHRPWGTWLGLAGFAAFIAVASYSTFFNQWTSLHGSRAQYRRIMHSHERIDAARRGAPVRFWFDKAEPAYHEYYGLNSIYLAEFSRLGDSFPRGCETPVDPGTLIAITSDKPAATDLARRALAGCWKRFGMLAVPVAEEAVALPPPAHGYALALLRAAAVASRWQPLRVDAHGQGTLVASSSPVPLPARGWRPVAESPDDPPHLAVTPAGLQVRTPRGQFRFAAEYGPLTAPAAGQYRFALRYRRGGGRIAFAARPATGGEKLGIDRFGHRAGSGYEMAFWVALKAGDAVVLQVMNQDLTGHGAATFLAESVSVIQVSPE